jgi:hypothetical protein
MKVTKDIDGGCIQDRALISSFPLEHESGFDGWILAIPTEAEARPFEADCADRHHEPHLWLVSWSFEP